MHLRVLLEQIEKLKTMTATARLADFILSLVGPQGGKAEISLPYEKRLVAGHLGMTPESFSARSANCANSACVCRATG